MIGIKVESRFHTDYVRLVRVTKQRIFCVTLSDEFHISVELDLQYEGGGNVYMSRDGYRNRNGIL